MIYNVYVPKKVVLPDTFSQATWDEIVYACQKNKVPETWVVGNSTNMIYWGDEEYQVDIIGKAHDDYADGSGKAPLTFMLHNLYGELWKMNDEDTNVGSWESCYMRTNRLPGLLEHFTAPAKDAVREVSKVSGVGGGSSATTTTSDKLFLASMAEIFGGIFVGPGTGETEYDYFTSKSKRKKYYGNNPTYWWTRTPYGGNDYSFGNVTDSGGTGWSSATNQYGIAFAFCL